MQAVTQSPERESFLSQVQMMKETDQLTPGRIADLDTSTKLNLIWDIDHTLIFSFDKKLYPDLDKKEKMNWGKNIHTLKLSGGYEMWLVVRYGYEEALDYLSTFCNFYVYSHGLNHYIHEILNLIDPHEKYFKNRQQNIVAPHNQQEQQKFLASGKRIDDFRDPLDRQKPLFSIEEFNKTLIVDDQYAAIYHKDHLVMSKKFLKYAFGNKDTPQEKIDHWCNYQFPFGQGKDQIQMMAGRHCDAWMEMNEVGSPSQLYHIANLITRCYLAKTLLSPQLSIQAILSEYRKSIFKDHKFFFEDFLTTGLPPQAAMTTPEKGSALRVMGACKSIVEQLGGRIVTSKIPATHIVLHQTAAKKKNLEAYRKDQKVVNFRYIMECYFQMMRLKTDGDREDLKFEVETK